jgi:hypothetical protein
MNRTDIPSTRRTATTALTLTLVGIFAVAGWVAAPTHAQVPGGNETMKDLEYEIAALPALTAPELAVKLIALSTFGEYGLDDFKNSVFNDARALIEGVAL